MKKSETKQMMQSVNRVATRTFLLMTAGFQESDAYGLVLGSGLPRGRASFPLPPGDQPCRSTPGYAFPLYLATQDQTAPAWCGGSVGPGCLTAFSRDRSRGQTGRGCLGKLPAESAFVLLLAIKLNVGRSVNGTNKDEEEEDS